MEIPSYGFLGISLWTWTLRQPLGSWGDGKWKHRYTLISAPGVFLVQKKMVHSRRVVLKHLQRCGHNWLIFWRQLRKGGNQSHCTHCTQRNLGNTKEVPLSKTAQDDWTKPFILKKKKILSNEK